MPSSDNVPEVKQLLDNQEMRLAFPAVFPVGAQFRNSLIGQFTVGEIRFTQCSAVIMFRKPVLFKGLEYNGLERHLPGCEGYSPEVIKTGWTAILVKDGVNVTYPGGHLGGLCLDPQ